VPVCRPELSALVPLGLVSLTGDDADELLPHVTRILCEALLQLVSREEVERQLDVWFASRLSG
jgi:hypothetical protein